MQVEKMEQENVVSVTNLTYQYNTRHFGARRPALVDVNFTLPRGARCLLVGGNGSGKSTLLKVLGGRLLVPAQSAMVLGRSCYHDSTLVQDVAYLGEWWRREFTDISVAEVLKDLLTDANTAPRVHEIAQALEIDLAWPLSAMSDGQRRRVQIIAGLARPKPVLLLDEVTAELDLFARRRLCGFLTAEADRGATIVLATHIYDALESMTFTHVIRCSHGYVSVYDASRILQSPAAARISGPGPAPPTPSDGSPFVGRRRRTQAEVSETVSGLYGLALRWLEGDAVAAGVGVDVEEAAVPAGGTMCVEA